jgi:hypothetical protein
MVMRESNDLAFYRQAQWQVCSSPNEFIACTFERVMCGLR